MSKRVVINLRPDVPAEADFINVYEAMPRRAEWVRRMLLRGFIEEQRRGSGVLPKPLTRQSSIAAGKSIPVSGHDGGLIKSLTAGFRTDQTIGEGDDR
jgi:hypothetical protein